MPGQIYVAIISIYKLITSQDCAVYYQMFNYHVKTTLL